MEKRVSLVLTWLLISAILAACGLSQTGLDSKATEIPARAFETQTVEAPKSTPAPTRVPPDVKAKVSGIDVFCPTENEQARQYYNAGIELSEQGRLEEAKDLYLQAIQLDLGYCDAMDNLGLLFRRQGNIEEAIYWYKRSIDIFPENPAAHQNLALAYWIQGKTTEAEAEYQLLVRLYPDHPEGYYGLGLVYLDLDQPREAVTQLNKAEELYAKISSPFTTDARYLLGISHYRLEEWTTARDYFEQIYPQVEDYPAINFYLGMCYLSQELLNLELAEKYLSRAKQLGFEIPSEVLEEFNW